jgi:hypothetical protein
MSRSSQRHNREIYGKDSADQIDIDGTGGGYGGGAVLPIGTLTGLISPWPAPTSLSVVTAGGGESTVSWVIPSPDPGDGSTIFGYLLVRNGVEVFRANLTSPQTDTGPLVVGEVYNYKMWAFDSEGRLTQAAAFDYTHS